MNITYWELKETIWELAKKHWLPQTRLEEIYEIEEETDETALELMKIEFLNWIEQILNITTITQISWKDHCDEWKYDIDFKTELSRESVFKMYSHVHETQKQQLYVELAYSFITEEQADILDSLLEAYSMNWNEEVRAYSKDIKLIEKFPKKSFMHKLVELILSWEDIFNAMKSLFLQNWVNPNNKKVIENADIPPEIKDFLYEFNSLLLSKLWIINWHVIEKDLWYKLYH